MDNLIFMLALFGYLVVKLLFYAVLNILNALS